jgi:tRNA(Ile2) C34 agmatinyltransferase TiaS
LREFHKCRGRLREVKKGDAVTVYGGGKRRSWKLAVVKKLIVGKDKEV